MWFPLGEEYPHNDGLEYCANTVAQVLRLVDHRPGCGEKGMVPFHRWEGTAARSGP